MGNTPTKGTHTGQLLPSSPQDCVAKLRSPNQQVQLVTSAQIAFGEYTRLKALADNGGTVELLRLFNTTKLGDPGEKIHFCALQEMIMSVPEEVVKLASSKQFINKLGQLLTFYAGSSFGGPIPDNAAVILSFIGRFFGACDTAKIPMASALAEEDRIKICNGLSKYMNYSSPLPLLVALMGLAGVLSAGVLTSTEIHLILPRFLVRLSEMPLDRETIHAHMISMVIVEEYISVPSFDFLKWFDTKSINKYISSVVNKLALQGGGADMELLKASMRVYLNLFSVDPNIVQDGRVGIAWSNFIVALPSVPKPLKSIAILMILLLQGSQMRTVFAILTGAFSLKLAEKQQKFLVSLYMLLFEAKDLPTSETAPKLIYIIRLMLDQVNTPQATPKKLAMMSDLTASVHAKNEIGLEEYQVIVEKLSSTALAMLQTTCSRPTVDRKSIGMLVGVLCAHKEYFNMSFNTPPIMSLLQTLLHHADAQVFTFGLVLLYTWTSELAWNVWSPVVSSLIPTIAQSMANNVDKVIMGASFLYQITTTKEQALNLLPPKLHIPLVKSCLATFQKDRESVLIDLIRLVHLVDNTKGVLSSLGVPLFVVNQMLIVAIQGEPNQATIEALFSLFMVIEDSVYAVKPPWNELVDPLLKVSSSSIEKSLPLLNLTVQATVNSSCSQILATNPKIVAKIFQLIKECHNDEDIKVLVSIVWNMMAYGHLNRKTLSDDYLAIIYKLVDPSRDELMHCVAGVLWQLNETEGAFAILSKQYYQSVSAILSGIEQGSIMKSRFTCTGLLGKLAEKGVLSPVDQKRALASAHKLSAASPEELGVMYTPHEFRVCLGTWLNHNAAVELQELALWAAISISLFQPKQNLAVNSLASALATGTFIHALSISSNAKKSPSPLLLSLSLQFISSVWKPTQGGEKDVCHLVLNKTDLPTKSSAPMDSEFAREDINRVDASNIKQLPQHKKGSEARERLEALVKLQYAVLEEFEGPSARSQIVAICLRSNMTPFAPLVISIGCKEEPMPTEIAQLSGIIMEWKKKFGIGRKVLVLSLQPYFVQSILLQTSKNYSLHVEEPRSSSSNTNTSIVVRSKETQLATFKSNSVSLMDDPARLNPKASLQRCAICLTPLRGVTEASLKYADATTVQSTCPACNKSKERIEEASRLQGKGEWLKAFSIWEELAQKNPSHAFFHTQSALCAFKAEKYEEAHTACERAVRLKDADPNGHLWNLLLYSKLGSGRMIEAARSIIDGRMPITAPSLLINDVRGQVKKVLKEEIEAASKILPQQCAELIAEAEKCGIKEI